jgi:N-acylglucosamine 2-epimerase
MPAPPNFKELLSFYRQRLYEDVFRYWLKQVDWQHGGVLNCLSNCGERRSSDHKFVWSQGRFVWQCARAYAADDEVVSAEMRQSFLEAARLTARFLMSHARLPNGNCAFILSRTGRPVLLDEREGAQKPPTPARFDFSIHADNFAAYGVGEYARASIDREAWNWAKDLFAAVLRRHRENTACYDFPYPPPPGCRMHGTPMGLLEYSQELAQAAVHFGDTTFAAELQAAAAGCASEIFAHFVQSDNLIAELLDADFHPLNTLLGRYRNPGHTLECVWFLIHWALRTDNRVALEKAAQIAQATCRVAWDADFGGIPQFMDQNGGEPQGFVPPELENAIMVRKLRSLWDKKLWWPHAEALYALLLIYEQTGQAWALEEFQRFHDYAFKTFPNPDGAIGEWIQIRNRQGEPEDAVVALPVKDPMHIARSFLHIIETLKRLTKT